MEIEQILATSKAKDGSVLFEVKWANSWLDEKTLREKVKNKSHLIAQMLSVQRIYQTELANFLQQKDESRKASKNIIVIPEMRVIQIKQEPLDKSEEFENSEITIFMCDVCNAAFNTHAALNDHKIECEKTVTSSRDGSSSQQNLNSQSTDSTSDKINDYGKGCVSTDNNPSTITTEETNIPIFECENCHMTFADEEYLIRHKVRCKNHEFSNFRCDICQRGFTAKGSLELHVDSVHLKKKEFGCSLCGKLFSRKHILKIHLDTHYGKRNFQCAYCGKTFLQKSNLNRHERIHQSKNFGYRCRFCGQAFTQNKHLQKHTSTIHVEQKTDTSS